MKPVILLDVDGVLADFCAGYLGLIEEITGIRYGNAVITDWSITKSPFFAVAARESGIDVDALTAKCWKRAKRIGFCSSLPVIGGAETIAAVRELRKIGHVEVLTSPLAGAPTWMSERVEWLERHFDFAPDDVHFVSKKFRVAGDVLVDDKPSHIIEWMDANVGGTGLLWTQPYNAQPVPNLDIRRVDSWSSIIEIVHGAAELLEHR